MINDIRSENLHSLFVSYLLRVTVDLLPLCFILLKLKEIARVLQDSLFLVAHTFTSKARITAYILSFSNMTEAL